MNTDRYVVLGLAHVRSTWFTEVARWATSGSAPIEFVKCLSTEELRARVHSGRPFSAALLDGRLPAVDRDLIATLRDAGIASLVVRPTGSRTDWNQLGAATDLAEQLDRVALIDALVSHTHPVGAAHHDLGSLGPSALPPAWAGRLVAVTGRNGCGTSTVAIALAQAMADDPRNGNEVILADLARHAHQALLHDARDVVPGIQELVEAHRNGYPTSSQIRELLYTVPDRGYRLLLGLRRPSDWVTIRSRAFAAALDGLRSAGRLVVADIDSDLEGEATTGSIDIEDHNLMARRVTHQADAVVIVATPTTTGIHGLLGQLHELREHCVPGSRMVVVVNRAPRGARARAEITRSIAQLAGGPAMTDPYVGPVFVPERRHVDHLHRDLARLPSLLTHPPARAVTALLEREGSRAHEAEIPEPVAPGSLGRWADDEEATS